MSFVQRCHEHAARSPEALAFTYLTDGRTQERSLTRGELEQRALAVAQELVARGLSGRRVLLLYVPGLEFVVALLGCLYAGAIAVPAYPPEPGRLQRTLPRLLAILGDCSPALVLTTGELLAMAPFVLGMAPELASLAWASSEEWAARSLTGAALPSPGPEDLAFLQYTSGSTAMPKGVMISHGNLLAQALQTQAYRGYDNQVAVSWLPFYHDLGLIGFILMPLWLGCRAVLMSPLDFMKRPLSWLQAIDTYRADASPAPPFALDLCVRKLQASDVAGLDLSCWKMLPIGAEPIHRAPLERFSELLRPCGFRPEALLPAYGLAEAVLLVSGHRLGQRFVARCFSAAALREGRVEPADGGALGTRELVGNGSAVVDQRIEIVDPSTLRRCDPDQVGEIWVAGPNVARGYWNRPADSASTFGARLADSGEGPFLRTGDLGFSSKGQLYVVSRLKDLIIIRGKNHHPADLEQTVLGSHALLRPGGCAAFSVEGEAEEQLVVVAEVSARDLPEGAGLRDALQEIDQAIRRAVGAQHELLIHTVSLLEPGQLPKTSSGKIARRPAREEFLAGRLAEFARFTQEQPEAAGDTKPVTDGLVPPPTSRTYEELVAWLSSWLAGRLRSAQGAVAPLRPFVELGLDSTEAVAIAGDLASALGRPVPATALYDFPNLTTLARYLAAPGVPAEPRTPDSARASDGSGAPAAPGCMVLLSGGGSGRPLFLLPGLFGVLSAFSQLVKELSGRLPIWGLDLPVHRGLPSPTSIPELAARYAEELCAVPGAEPYRLLGYCSGGMVGLEVARQLRQRGRAVERLLLLDAPCLDSQRTDLSQLRREAQLAGERHSQLTLPQAVRLIVRHILGKQWAFGEGEELAEQMVRGGTANLSTFQGYEPQPLSVPALLFSAHERIRIPMYEEDAEKNAQRWSQLVGGSLAQLVVTGNHHTMLQAPHVRELAQRLLAELLTESPAGGR